MIHLIHSKTIRHFLCYLALRTSLRTKDARKLLSVPLRISKRHPDKNGLILGLAHLAQEYEQRAGQIRQVAPLSMIADTLETKAGMYKESIQQLGGIRL